MVRKLDIQVARRAVAVVFAATLCVLRIFANDGFDDGVGRSDPKFVVAWLVFALAVVYAGLVGDGRWLKIMHRRNNSAAV